MRKEFPSMPKPWYVAAYSGAALGNVLQSDYGATFRDGHFYVAGGDMIRIDESGDLYGTHGGTIFVLYDPLSRSQPELDRILRHARERYIRIEPLQDRHMSDQARTDPESAAGKHGIHEE